MKAIRMHTRGGPELLVYEEVPKPAPSDGDALVRVDACAITPTELSWSETYTTRDGAERLPTQIDHRGQHRTGLFRATDRAQQAVVECENLIVQA